MDALGQEEHYKYSPKRELLQKHVPEVLLSGRVGQLAAAFGRGREPWGGIWV